VNPGHVRGYSAALCGRLEATLRAHDVRPEIVYTSPGAAIAPRIAAEAPHFDLFLVWGGDGTVGDVASGLLGTGKPLGVLPGGAFNNIAWALGIPRDPLLAARRLALAQARAMDMGFANGHVFLEVAGVGGSGSTPPCCPLASD
jgi:diacylglycerol kinase family enzyme